MQVIVAIITSAGMIPTAITALLVNHHEFKLVGDRITTPENSVASRFASIDSRFASVERRLEVIEGDLKNFCNVHAEHEKRIARLENR